MNKSKKSPYDFILLHYGDPGGDDPVKRWLPHPNNARAVCAALLVNGMSEQELEDAMQDVFVRVLSAFDKGIARVPADLREMKAFCANIAKKHAMATLRKATRRERLGNDGICEADADEYTPLEYGAPVQRDPVDASRQLEVLAQLFRDGRMPARGVDILEGIMGERTYEEIAQELEITADAVEGRLRMMRERYRARMARLGMLPHVRPLELIVSTPAAIEALREAA